MDHKKILDDALAAEKNNRFQDGIEIIRKGLRQFPGNPDLVLTLARLHERIKMWAQAQAIYSKLVEPGGKMKGPVAIGLAHCMLGQQKWEEARKLLAPLLQAAPKNVDVLVGLARCAEQRKDNADAQKLLDRAKEFAPNDRALVHQQARLHVANKAPSEAITLLEKNIDRDDPWGDSIDLWLETCKEQKRD